MKKKIVILFILVIGAVGIYKVYSDYLKNYELVINEQVVYEGNRHDLNVEKELDEFLVNLENQSYEKIMLIENEYNSIINKVDTIVTKNSEYNYTVLIKHDVERSIDKELPYIEETVVNPEKLISAEPSVIKEGVIGLETKNFIIEYHNGNWFNNNDYKIETTPAINKVIEVGGKQPEPPKKTITSGNNSRSRTTNQAPKPSSTSGTPAPTTPQPTLRKGEYATLADCEAVMHQTARDTGKLVRCMEEFGGGWTLIVH